MSKHICILGAQFGDEGKGKITQDLGLNYDWCIRFSGGSNVGAKVVKSNNKVYVHHLLPVIDYGISNAKGFLGSEMVINMPALLEEIKMMQQDFSNVAHNTYIDIDAFIVEEKHIV